MSEMSIRGSIPSNAQMIVKARRSRSESVMERSRGEITGTHACSRGTSSPNRPVQLQTPHAHDFSSPSSDSRFFALPLHSSTLLLHSSALLLRSSALLRGSRSSLLHGSCSSRDYHHAFLRRDWCPQAQSKMVSQTGQIRRDWCSCFPSRDVT